MQKRKLETTLLVGLINSENIAITIITQPFVPILLLLSVEIINLYLKVMRLLFT